MAKKSATFNLEESAWKDIHDFMDKHGVNRNTAIEWMLVERRTMLSTMNRSAIQNEVNVDPKPTIKKEVKKEEPAKPKGVIPNELLMKNMNNTMAED